MRLFCIDTHAQYAKITVFHTVHICVYTKIFHSALLKKRFQVL